MDDWNNDSGLTPDYDDPNDFTVMSYEVLKEPTNSDDTVLLIIGRTQPSRVAYVALIDNDWLRVYSMISSSDTLDPVLDGISDEPLVKVKINPTIRKKIANLVAAKQKSELSRVTAEDGSRISLISGSYVPVIEIVIPTGSSRMNLILSVSTVLETYPDPMLRLSRMIEPRFLISSLIANRGVMS